MKVDKKANFCIFFVIAILALGLSNLAAAYTGDFVSGSFPGINDTDKMIALDNDNFAPLGLNAVYEQKVVEEVNETDNETETNSTIEEDASDNNGDSSNSNANANQNDNSDSETDTITNSNENENSGNDNSESSPSTEPSDSSAEE